MSRPVDPRLLREARGARVAVAGAVGLGLVTTALVLVQAGLLASLLAGALLEPAAGLAGAGPQLVVLAVVVAARAGITALGSRVALRCSADVKATLRDRVLRHAQRLGPSWLAGERGGELATLLTRGLDALDPWFARYLPQLVLAVLVPVAVLVRVASVDVLSAVVIGVTLPLLPLFMALVGLHTRDRTARSYDQLAALAGHFLDAVRGMPTLRLHGRAVAHAASVRRAGEAHRQATMRTLRVAFLSAFVLELVASLSVALVAVEVGLRLVHGSMPYESALLVLLLAPEAYLPLRKVGAEFHASQDAAAAADRVFEVLGTQPGGAAAAAPAPAPTGARLVLAGVTVHLPGRDGPVLDGLDLVLAAGERVAVVGTSGAGKSTLLDVLLRFRELDAGTMALSPDHGDPRPPHVRNAVHDTAHIPSQADHTLTLPAERPTWTAFRTSTPAGGLAPTEPEVWRRRIAWLPQAPRLFVGTVADNVRLGAPGASDHEVARVLDAVRLAGTADTLLGEDGSGMSAGERRRVALARALLRVRVAGADLLLLDEPTESLDALSAAAVRSALEQLPRSVSVLSVTHDPGLAGAADRVLVLDAGRLRPRPRPTPTARPVEQPVGAR